uniref:ROK family transcriptional regulator n=1 Tax=Agromyces laixinhei TaxID=2585717 RepID=UPI0012EEBDA4
MAGRANNPDSPDAGRMRVSPGGVTGRMWVGRGGQFESQAAVRQKHLQRVLQHVLRDAGTATRASIARRTGLTSATISSLVAELITLGLVADGEHAESTGGKRPTTLRMDRSTFAIVAVVVRARSLRLGLLDLTGTTVAETTKSFASAPSADDIVQGIRELTGGLPHRLLAIGIQVPGTSDQGVVVESVQLGWSGVPIAQIIEDAVGAPAYLLNDADAEALADAAIDRETVSERLLVHLGEGVGSALTVGGILVRGFSGRAGEIGHVRVVFEAERTFCRCGLSGCLESTASLTAMLGDGFHDDLDDASIALLSTARDSHDRMALGTRALSRALRMLSAMLDPEEILIGGSAPSLGGEYLSMLQDEFEMYPAKGTRTVRIRYSKAGGFPFIGAAQFALRSELGVSWCALEELQPTVSAGPAGVRAAGAGAAGVGAAGV